MTKFSLQREKVLRVMLHLLFLPGVLLGSTLATGQSFPFLTTVGIIPIQVENDISDPRLDQAFKNIGHHFTQSLETSQRFRFLDQRLVRELWYTAEGRQQLKSKFELHAFIGLSVELRGDVVRLNARMLNLGLETYLLETHNGQAADWLGSRLPALQKRKIEALAYRLLNRLPVDMVVTSVQGKYVTLSGGSRQKLVKGEVYDVLRPTISQRHPVNGSWLRFKSLRAGKVRALEVNQNSTIAEIISATDSRAIVPGDGIKVNDITSRVAFRDNAEEGTFKDHKEPRLYSIGSGKIKKVPQPKIRKKLEPKPARRMADVGEQEPLQPIDEAPTPDLDESLVVGEGEEDAENDEEAEPGFVDRTIDSVFSLMSFFPERELAPGIRQWKAKGAAGATSKMPFWLVNHLRVLGRSPFSQIFDLEGKFSIDLGQTGGGFSTGFGFGGGLVSQAPIMGEGIMLHWRVGSDFESRATKGDRYGGHDMLSFGGRVGVGGKSNLLGDGLGWQAGLSLTLFGLGQAGVSGKKVAIKSLSGSGLYARITSGDSTEGKKFGLSLEMNNSQMKTPRGTVKFTEQILLVHVTESF